MNTCSKLVLNKVRSFLFLVVGTVPIFWWAWWIFILECFWRIPDFQTISRLPDSTPCCNPCHCCRTKAMQSTRWLIVWGIKSSIETSIGPRSRPQLIMPASAYCFVFLWRMPNCVYLVTLKNGISETTTYPPQTSCISMEGEQLSYNSPTGQLESAWIYVLPAENVLCFFIFYQIIKRTYFDYESWINTNTRIFNNIHIICL